MKYLVAYVLDIEDENSYGEANPQMGVKDATALGYEVPDLLDEIISMAGEDITVERVAFTAIPDNAPLIKELEIPGAGAGSVPVKKLR